MGRTIKFRSWLKDKQQMLYDFSTISDHPMLSESKKTVLMQYTGMKDRDGGEVFEGDIVELSTKYGKDVGVVVFIEGCFKVRWDSKSKFPKNREMIGHYYINSKTKVIGNIYEQPDLIVQ